MCLLIHNSCWLESLILPLDCDEQSKYIIYYTIFTNVTLDCLGADMYIFGEGLLCYTILDINVIYCI